MLVLERQFPFLKSAVLHRAAFYNVIGLLLTVNFFAQDECWRCHVGEWLDIPAQVAEVDAIVVLGGDVAHRLPLAVELFQAGVAPELWYTGAAEESLNDTGNETSSAYRRAVELGVPAEAITLLATTSTWEDAKEIAAAVQARGTHSILVVTSWYHGRRALCAIQQQVQDSSVQVYYQPAATPGFGPADWWQVEAGQRIVTTELYKIIFYTGYYGLTPWIC